MRKPAGSSRLLAIAMRPRQQLNGGLRHCESDPLPGRPIQWSTDDVKIQQRVRRNICQLAEAPKALSRQPCGLSELTPKFTKGCVGLLGVFTGHRDDTPLASPH
jgi:hypothetical protein